MVLYDDDWEKVEKVVGFEINSLYLYCLKPDQLCGKLGIC
jgi:hypothetical protein